MWAIPVFAVDTINELSEPVSPFYYLPSYNISDISDYITENNNWQEWVLSRIREEGFDVATADRIIYCESAWKTHVTHLNDNGTYDIGLWQINDVHGLTWEDRMDPYISTEFAITLMKSKRGLKHWVCY